METVKEGVKIKILCEAKLEDGTLCYQNEEDKPLELVIGEGKFFPALEKELKKMKVGDKKTITLKPEEAFGPHMDDLVMEVPKNAFPMDANITVGSRVKIKKLKALKRYADIFQCILSNKYILYALFYHMVILIVEYS